MRAQAGLLGTAGTGWDVGWHRVSGQRRGPLGHGVTLPVESGVLSVTPADDGAAPALSPTPVPSPILVPVSDCVPLARVPEAGFP
jgi:hypothetical protein